MAIVVLDRVPGRHRLRGAPQHGGRPRRHHVRAVRDLHAELPAGPPAHLRVRRHPALAADLRLRRSARGGWWTGCARWCCRRSRSGWRWRRCHAHAALEPARGARRGLRAHGARQGRCRSGASIRGHVLQERADPRRHRARAAARHADRRRRHHRVRVRAARRRPARRRRGVRARLSAGAGRDPADRARLHREQPARRSALWLARSPHPRTADRRWRACARRAARRPAGAVRRARCCCWRCDGLAAPLVAPHDPLQQNLGNTLARAGRARTGSAPTTSGATSCRA